MSSRGAAAVERALADRDAAAFVHVGPPCDPDLRYLVDVPRLEAPCAYVQTATGERLLCPGPGDAAVARERFDGTVRDAVSFDADAPGARAAALVAATCGEGATVLVAPDVPHASAVYLERDGHAVTSTDALERGRALKGDSEVERLRRVQRAATAGVARAETLLAESTVGADGLVHEGGTVTTTRLAREVDAALAEAGVASAGNTLVAAGADAAAPRLADERAVDAGETMLVDVAPCGPGGYYGRLARTFVVDTAGGWDRRAHLAVTRAREAGLDEVGAGVETTVVHTETAAEVMAYGFDVGPDSPAGFSGPAGHGVGLSAREAPSFERAETLTAGHVVALAPEVSDPERGGVRVADLLVVTEDGYEPLADYPTGITPARR
ncbi:hypothetical protein GCM10009037_16510 [Halarchaeum grantii]|uniref:Peptidase M24 domain-containing protein n=1 Tax=Halarchaeum grantii TaxID=1193105 RepID=A0A830F9S1_9EURY|nr:M24 family metallopeptidase [Halarchaeum grantii]GGL33576.1 hypothetical protein GCM10009037_16510 [Halarchaeum grantii]